MFGSRRPSLTVEVPEADPDTKLLQTPNRRLSYLQRVGVLSDKSDLDDGLSQASTETPTSVTSESSESSTTSMTPLSHNDARQKYLRKLAYNKVWVPQAQRSPKHQTVVIFDWDDTLLPTTWLREQDYHPGDSDEEDDLLQKIEQHSKSLLEIALRAGHTYIVTNASSGWVEYSAARWAPGLLPVLRRVPVISARDKFEAAYPEVRQWKIQAFLELQRQLDATPVTNLVALGDADYEIQAARIMGDEFEEGLVKTVKFRPHPDLEEHLIQVEIVNKNLERVVGSVRNLKVCLERVES